MSLTMTLRPPAFRNGSPVIADTSARVSGRSAPDTPFGFRSAMRPSPAVAHSPQFLRPPSGLMRLMDDGVSGVWEGSPNRVELGSPQ